MATTPPPLTAAQLRARRARVARTARRLGFVGRVEYRHASSRSGGAQYQPGRDVADDRLIVYAEAFDRDANPEDFSLRAMVAHERGHQICARHPGLSAWRRMRTDVSEEVLASLLGARLVGPGQDWNDLEGKAAWELVAQGLAPDEVRRLIRELLDGLEALS